MSDQTHLGDICIDYSGSCAQGQAKLLYPMLAVGGGGGGGRGSSVGRACDSWSGGPGFDPRCGRPLPTGSVGVSIM